jgi:hypothetical protein
VYRRQVLTFALMYTCCAILNGCDPVLEERKRNGLEVEPFAPREYIRVRQTEEAPSFAEELHEWVEAMEQVEDAVLVERSRKLYVGVLSSGDLAVETEQNMQELLRGWVNQPEVEEVYVTFDTDVAAELMSNPDIVEDEISPHGWILLEAQK